MTPAVIVCPDCGSPFDIVTDGAIGEPYAAGATVHGAPVRYRRRLAPFAACSGCENCIELRPLVAPARRRALLRRAGLKGSRS